MKAVWMVAKKVAKKEGTWVGLTADRWAAMKAVPKVGMLVSWMAVLKADSMVVLMAGQLDSLDN